MPSAACGFESTSPSGTWQVPLLAKHLGSSQLPSLTRHTTEETIRRLIVRDAHGLRIPYDLATRAVGHVAKVIGFRQRTRIAEGAAGGGAVADGGEEFGVVLPGQALEQALVLALEQELVLVSWLALVLELEQGLEQAQQ